MEENKRLNDEDLKNAVGGSGLGLRTKPMYAHEATIIGPVSAELGCLPTHDGSLYNVSFMNGSYLETVVAETDSSVAGFNKDIFQAGDRVYVDGGYRGDVNYRIFGLISDFE